MRRDVVLRKVKENKGFTLMESLIVVAIMTVLTAFSFVAIGDMKETVEMTELDDYAKSVYLEAQNRLSAIEVEGGMPQFYDELSNRYADHFLSENAPVDYLDADEEWKNICYVTRDEAIEVGLMPQNSYSSSMSGNYVLELNAQTGDVYGAFYWENEDDINYTNVIETLDSRRRSDRVDSELGYYGGASMNTIALLENAPADDGTIGGAGGNRGGFVYYEEYADGTYGALVVGDAHGKIYLKGYDYDQSLASLSMGNTLRDEKCVKYGFAMFNGLTGYWRWQEDFRNTQGGIQDWPLISESFPAVPNFLNIPGFEEYYTIYKLFEEPGELAEPTKDGYWGWNGQGRGWYVKYLIAYCDQPHGHYTQLSELTEFFNRFLELRYEALNAE